MDQLQVEISPIAYFNCTIKFSSHYNTELMLKVVLMCAV